MWRITVTLEIYEFQRKSCHLNVHGIDKKYIQVLLQHDVGGCTAYTFVDNIQFVCSRSNSTRSSCREVLQHSYKNWNAANQKQDKTVPTLKNPSQAVQKSQQCIKLRFEPGLGNQDTPYLCVVFSNIQETILHYNIEVVLVRTIEAHRVGGIAPLILNVGTDGTSG